MRIDAYKREADSVFSFSLCEPAKCVVEVAQPRVDNRDLISRNPILMTLGNDLVQNGLRFLAFADLGRLN